MGLNWQRQYYDRVLHSYIKKRFVPFGMHEAIDVCCQKPYLFTFNKRQYCGEGYAKRAHLQSSKFIWYENRYTAYSFNSLAILLSRLQRSSRSVTRSRDIQLRAGAGQQCGT